MTEEQRLITLTIRYSLSSSRSTAIVSENPNGGSILQPRVVRHEPTLGKSPQMPPNPARVAPPRRQQCSEVTVQRSKIRAIPAIRG